MATSVLMEALSPTMEEGRLVEWKKAEGDPVAVGDVLAEVETDKAVMELVARAPGVLLKQVAAPGQTVPVTAVIGWIGAPGETVGGETPGPSSPRPRASSPPRPLVPSPPRPFASSPPKASPLARKIARERGLDLSAIEGSGPEGRVIKRDLDRVIAPPEPGAVVPAGAGIEGGYRDEPLTQIRKTIAKRLVQSLGPVPTFYLTAEVDMERAAEARGALQAEFGEEGKVSFNDLVLKATATALRRHPACNAWWGEDHIRYWDEVHLGLAVAIPEGLITPVIRHADRKPLRAIAAEARDLARRARERKLAPAEYTGATFSVSNLGMLDIDEFTAIINPPEAGILAVGRIAEKPVAHQGQVAVRRRMRLTLSCDHRVIDGATGAEFLRTLRRMLENPLALVW